MGGYPVRTTEGVLTTQRAVCLLRSRRRTSLCRLIVSVKLSRHLSICTVLWRALSTKAVWTGCDDQLRLFAVRFTESSGWIPWGSRPQVCEWQLAQVWGPNSPPLQIERIACLRLKSQNWVPKENYSIPISMLRRGNNPQMQLLFFGIII